MALTLVIVYLGIIVSALWKYISTKDITNSTVEIFLIVMIPISIGWFARKDESLMLPRDLTGDTLPTSEAKADRTRRKRHYFWDALGFAIFVLVMNIVTSLFIEKDFNDMLLFPNINSTMNIVLSLSLQFVITVVVFYLIGYVLNEWSVRKYNKKMDELENKDE